jgi:putative transposase
MGSVGDAYDNAMAVSFFATLECELISRRRFRRPAEAEAVVFAWIEGCYNPRRRHSSLGYRSPNEFERLHAEGAVEASTARGGNEVTARSNSRTWRGERGGFAPSTSLMIELARRARADQEGPGLESCQLFTEPR